MKILLLLLSSVALLAQAPIMRKDGGAFTGAVSGTQIRSALTTVSFSATPTFDAALGNSFLITLTGNVTSSTLSNAGTGQIITLRICQDATGSRTFVPPTNVLNMGTINSAASSCSTQTFIYDGSNAQAIGLMISDGPPAIVLPGSSSGSVKLQAEAAAAGTANIADNSTTVIPNTGAANEFLTAVAADGTVSRAQPTEANLSTSDITTNNATTSKHGFLLKLNNDANQFMNGQGAWATPAGGGSFDPFGSRTSVYFTEDFLGGYVNSATLLFASSGLAWSTYPAGGGGATSIIAGVASHPGILRLTTGGAGSATFGNSYAADAATNPYADMSANDDFELQTIFRIQGAATSNLHARIGFISNGTAAVQANFIGLRFDNINLSDTNFQFETRASSTSSVADSGVAVDTNWHHLRIWSTTAGTINFAIDGGSTSSLSANVPTASLAAGAAVSSDNATAKQLDVDWIAFQQTLSR